MADIAELVIDLNDPSLTWGDIEDIETVAGVPFSSISEKSINAKIAVALIWVFQRHNDPTFTLEDARAVKVANTMLVPSRPDPTNGNAPKRAPRSRSRAA